MRGSSESLSTDVLIVGAGLTGLSAAYHCDTEHILVESSNVVGGTAGTIHRDDFHLDRGVHILYFRDPWTRKWITDELGVELTRHTRKCVVYMNGRYAPYPVQFNLGAFPLSQRLRYGSSMLLGSKGNGEAAGFADWAHANFGSALAEDFFIPYNEKLWGRPADVLTTEWMDGYVPKPSVRSALAGMMRSPLREYGTNSEFWYPKSGGIDTLAEAIGSRLSPTLFGQRLVKLDLERRTAEFSTGLVISYGKLVSTIPLPRLLGCIERVPQQVRESQERLVSNGTTFAHILVPRPGLGDDTHWIYVPDPSVPFYRVTLPHCIDRRNCPDGWSALTLEFGGLQSQFEALEKTSVDALITMGLLGESDIDSQVIWDRVDYGYVTYDAHIFEARSRTLSWLASSGVVCLGRYGRWEYSNMESALLQGRSVSRRLNGSDYRDHSSSTSQRPKLRPVRDYFATSYNKRQGGIAGVLLKKGTVDRRRQISRWIPQWEGLSVLDAGCGDGSFLKGVLHGTPSHIRVEDCVAGNVESARRCLLNSADSVSGSTADSISVSSVEMFDIVLALGVFDYETEWEDALRQLAKRCRHTLIIDIPKRFTFHSVLRSAWLRAHKISLHTADRNQLERLLRSGEYRSAVVETPLHWIVRVDCYGEDT